MKSIAIVLITPVADKLTEQQQTRFSNLLKQVSYQLVLAKTMPYTFSVTHLIGSGSEQVLDLANAIEPQASANFIYNPIVYNFNTLTNTATRRRKLLIRDAVQLLDASSVAFKLLVWLDADDAPSGYWLTSLTNCYTPLNILACLRHDVVAFASLHLTAAYNEFKRLADGANGVGCGSAIAWRYDLCDEQLMPYLKLTHPLYNKYDGIEDLITGIEVARIDPNLLSFVAGKYCNPDCSCGFPAIYVYPSYTLGAPDQRDKRNSLLMQYRKQAKTSIQGIEQGYGLIS